MLKFFRVISIILTLVIMVLIFHLSSQNASSSSKMSGGLIEKTLSVIIPGFDEMDTENREMIISSLQFIVRKAAHAAIYFILGLCNLMSVITYYNLKIYNRIIISGVVGFVYAASDEIHQYFVPGRSCEFQDFLIDAVGCLFGIFFGYFVFRIVLKLIQRRKNNA